MRERQNYRKTALAIALFAAVAGAHAQKLRLAAGVDRAAPGDEVEFTLFHEPQSGHAASGLEWTVTSSANLPVTASMGTVAPEMARAGKTLQCVVNAQPAGPSTAVCLLIGGQSALPSGAVARFRLKIAEGAKPGNAEFELRQISAVTPEGKRITLPQLSGKVAVHTAKAR